MAQFHQEVAIKAQADAVWSVMADATTWPLWFPGMGGVPALSAVQAGTSFQWQEGSAVNTGRIIHAEPARLLEVVTHEGNRQATHRFELAYRNRLIGTDATEVDYQMEYDVPGGVLGDFVVGSNPIDMTRMKHALEKLRDLVEGGRRARTR